MNRPPLAKATANGAQPWRCPRCRRQYTPEQVTQIESVRHPLGVVLVVHHDGVCRAPLRLTPRGRQVGLLLCVASAVLSVALVAALVNLAIGAVR